MWLGVRVERRHVPDILKTERTRPPPPEPTRAPPPPQQSTWLSKYGPILTPVVLVVLAIVGAGLSLWRSVTTLNVTVAGIETTLESMDGNLRSLDEEVKELHKWHLEHLEKHHVTKAADSDPDIEQMVADVD